MNSEFSIAKSSWHSIAVIVLCLAVPGALLAQETNQETAMEDHIIGIGGVFMRAGDKDAVKSWYGSTLGIESGPYGHNFMWRHADDPDATGRTVWGFFERESTYFEGPYMINYIVRDMDALLAHLEAEGIKQLKPREDYEYGSFAWIKDPEDRWIELWEPIEKGFGEEQDE